RRCFRQRGLPGLQQAAAADTEALGSKVVWCALFLYPRPAGLQCSRVAMEVTDADVEAVAPVAATLQLAAVGNGTQNARHALSGRHGFGSGHRLFTRCLDAEMQAEPL